MARDFKTEEYSCVCVRACVRVCVRVCVCVWGGEGGLSKSTSHTPLTPPPLNFSEARTILSPNYFWMELINCCPEQLLFSQVRKALDAFFTHEQRFQTYSHSNRV